MRSASLAVISFIGLIGLGATWWFSGNASQGSSPFDDVDIELGRALYSENCASCHGANLEGQPDWRSPGSDGRLPAPPHDRNGHTWHHSDRILFSYTKLGGAELMQQQGSDFDSGMPGFAGKLTDQEIWNILGFIKSTWPERERNAQAARTAAEQQG